MTQGPSRERFLSVSSGSRDPSTLAFNSGVFSRMILRSGHSRYGVVNAESMQYVGEVDVNVSAWLVCDDDSVEYWRTPICVPVNIVSEKDNRNFLPSEHISILLPNRKIVPHLRWAVQIGDDTDASLPYVAIVELGPWRPAPDADPWNRPDSYARAEDVHEFAMSVQIEHGQLEALRALLPERYHPKPIVGNEASS